VRLAKAKSKGKCMAATTRHKRKERKVHDKGEKGGATTDRVRKKNKRSTETRKSKKIFKRKTRKEVNGMWGEKVRSSDGKKTCVGGG